MNDNPTCSGIVPDDHWPCPRCGAAGPTIKGHDPCIADLPSVVFACCGHGLGQAYVVLASGHVIRGQFDFEHGRIYKDLQIKAKELDVRQYEEWRVIDGTP